MHVSDFFTGFPSPSFSSFIPLLSHPPSSFLVPDLLSWFHSGNNIMHPSLVHPHHISSSHSSRPPIVQPSHHLITSLLNNPQSIISSTSQITRVRPPLLNSCPPNPRILQRRPITSPPFISNLPLPTIPLRSYSPPFLPPSQCSSSLLPSPPPSLCLLCGVSSIFPWHVCPSGKHPRSHSQPGTYIQ